MTAPPPPLRSSPQQLSFFHPPEASGGTGRRPRSKLLTGGLAGLSTYPRQTMSAMKLKSPPTWTADAFLELGRSYQAAAVFAAAADLDVFGPLADAALTAKELARRRRCNLRGMITLLDALVALRLLHKRGDRYSLPAGAAAFLTADGAQSILAMAQHQANCLRNWAQLARVVKTGRPAERMPSVRGAVGDAAAFIGAMHNIAAPVADRLIRAVRPLRFNHLLDVGGASGTWTTAFTTIVPVECAR